MSAWRLPTLALLSALAAVVAAWPVPGRAQARVADASIARVVTAVATLEGVRVRLAWVPGADSGELSVHAARVDATDLGYRYRDLAWRCPLQRLGDGWRCDGTVRSGNGAPLRLAVAFTGDDTDALLASGNRRLSLHRDAATPDDTRIDLLAVPATWAQALLAQAWEAGRLQDGTLDGSLLIRASEDRPLQVTGTLEVAGLALETPDASIAAQGIGGRMALDYRSRAGWSAFTVDGALHGGELLMGNTYIALPETPVAIAVDAQREGSGGWEVPRFAWRDGEVLIAEGSASLGADATLQALQVDLHSNDIAPLRDRYLSGWLGLAGLGDMEMSGALDASLRIADGALQEAVADLRDIGLADARGRFRFDGLSGTPRFSAGAPVASELRWRGGELYGLPFSAATLPLSSGHGEIRLREAVTLPAFGGHVTVDGLVLRPPAAGAPMRAEFGLALDRLDIAAIAAALDLPEFTGALSGNIPRAWYEDGRLQFDGGLAMQLFGGTVQVSALALERPFGVAPSLSADLVLDDIDLQSLTGVFDFGSISGKLDGRIAGLRLVDWTATAFDAELHTDRDAARAAGVRQRISQRAVQNISSVGDASFAGSLQGRLLAFFDDFGYRRIGISCELRNTVCLMGGLEPAPPASPGSGPGFIIVRGAGLPNLNVVGYNRLVDWPVLLERLADVAQGEVAPVVQ